MPTVMPFRSRRATVAGSRRHSWRLGTSMQGATKNGESLFDMESYFCMPAGAAPVSVGSSRMIQLEGYTGFSSRPQTMLILTRANILLPLTVMALALSVACGNKDGDTEGTAPVAKLPPGVTQNLTKTDR